MSGTYKPKFHIVPPQGWLNDPNGCCYYHGKYHVFFQYAPDSPLGGNKHWGHAVSEDLMHWEYLPIALYPDHRGDRDGAFSGTALVEDGILEVFYTGNVQEPGEHDWVREGQEQNVLYAESEDGITFSGKKILLTNDDFPEDLSHGIRDPKMWKRDGMYYMLLGARDWESKAALLLMKSSDKEHFEIVYSAHSPGDTGYMWECPDYFELHGYFFVAACPQGIKQQDSTEFQNVYHSGYFWLGDWQLENFQQNILPPERFSRVHFLEWDKGFDCYAPQTFLAPDGRRLLIGWAGLPDDPYDNTPAISEGWQNALTFPRELIRQGDQIYTPVAREIKAHLVPVEFPKETGAEGNRIVRWSHEEHSSFAVFINRDFGGKKGKILTTRDFSLIYKDEILSLEFYDSKVTRRERRHARVTEPYCLELYFDGSILELYINDGEVVMTTFYYPKQEIHLTVGEGYTAEYYFLR